jgi:4-amino-4-deoxy-L-arabinose transferase-like glycosyltransferase
VREGLSRPFWLVLVIAAFCAPLFFGLDHTDVENDEGIYSFAVDGILASGDWLNPPTSPHTGAVFLEKPPLKFWIVALPIRLGLLPHNEVGLRFWDALFGAIGFLYVFAIGRRIGGPVCGLLAAMTLFVYEPLLFEHGLRGNNMEAPLFLCYCGGIYHFLQWATDPDVRIRRRHVIAVALYFFLGFMTKFVAALFLPIVIATVALALPATRKRLVVDFRSWLVASAMVVALVVPWFVYQHFKSGGAVWTIMFGLHVLTRFTASLDTSHVHPWYYYWAMLWRGLLHVGTAWFALAGFALLCGVAWRQRRVEEITIIAWLVVPLALMSAGTSKLHHYLYPFIPPAALAVGFGPGWLTRTVADHLDRIMGAVHARLPSGGAWRAVRHVFLTLALAAGTIALATLVLSSINWKVGGVTIVRNSHIARPLFAALVLATLAGHGVAAARLIVPAALLMSMLPRHAYEDVIHRLQVEAHPLRSARDCLLSVRAGGSSEIAPGAGIYAIGEHKWFLHSYFYYLRHVGTWDRTEVLDPDRLNEALFVPGHERPVMIDEDNYRAFKASHGDAVRTLPLLPLREVLLLMPGPYAACAPRGTTRAPRSG